MAWLSNYKNIIRRRISPMLWLTTFLAISALAVALPLSLSTPISLSASAYAATSFTAQNSVQNQTPPGCTELIKNGDFETVGPEWELERGERPPMHVSDLTHNGSGKSMQLGITNLANVASTSFVKQTVNLPTGVTSLTLTFYYNTRWNPSPNAGDVQFVEVFNNLTGTFLTRVLTEQSNTGDWVVKQYDLMPYSGQQVSIYFVVENDGGTGSVAMNIDDVSILACNPLVPPTSTPTATQSPTLTPTIDTAGPTFTPQPTASSPSNTATAVPPPVVNPGNCQNYLADGNFDLGNAYFDNATGWKRGADPVQAQLTTAEKYSGTYAVQLGNPPNNGESNKLTYSSIRQLVNIPSSVANLELRWRHLSKSEEAADSDPPNTRDRSDVIFLDPDLTPIEVIHRHRDKPTTWQIETESVNAAKYSGRSFYVYFNVYNDGNGGRTWSFVDDIELIGCQTSAPLPTPAAAVAAATDAPAATATPVPTKKAEPTTAGQAATAAPTKTATQTILGPAVNAPEAANSVAQNKDATIMSTETEPIQGYSITPIQAAEGLQVPTTLPTYAPEGSGSNWFSTLFNGTDPDPQPTGTFQWLRMVVSCLLGIVVLGLLLFIVRAFVGRGRLPFLGRFFGGG